MTVILVTIPLHSQVYVGIGNIFDNLFNEPYEIAYALLDDGEIFSFTTKEDSRISASASFRKELIKKYGYSMDRVILLIHSHTYGLNRFSERDIIFLKNMRRYGFKGVYVLYYKPTNSFKVYDK